MQMKYYDITYKKPVEHDSGHPALGKLVAMEAYDSASMDDVTARAKFLITLGAPWDASGLEILSIVETSEENRPAAPPPHAIED